jgi:hypothetical protein
LARAATQEELVAVACDAQLLQVSTSQKAVNIGHVDMMVIIDTFTRNA